jgi:hypothetical protein
MPDEEIQLRGGFTTKDPRLDRLPEKDPRMQEFPTRRMLGRRADEPPKSKLWGLNCWLDQGREGACTGFSRAHNLAALPVKVKDVTEELAHRLYQRAKEIDQWPGTEHEGSSVLAAVRAAQEFGLVESFYWSFHIEDFLHGITYAGPCTVGCNWYSGMAHPDANGYIHPTGSIDGGHAIVVIGQELIYGGDGPYGLDMDRSYIVWHNSWGKSWGVQGRAKMTMRDFDRLSQEDAEICFSVDVATKRSFPSFRRR